METFTTFICYFPVQLNLLLMTTELTLSLQSWLTRSCNYFATVTFSKMFCPRLGQILPTSRPDTHHGVFVTQTIRFYSNLFEKNLLQEREVIVHMSNRFFILGLGGDVPEHFMSRYVINERKNGFGVPG